MGIALLDPLLLNLEAAHRWFAADPSLGWATCPLTENATLWILRNPRYPNRLCGEAALKPLLESMLVHPGHVFWSDVLCWIGMLSRSPSSCSIMVRSQTRICSS